MVLFVSSHTVSYYSSIVTMFPSCTISETLPLVCELPADIITNDLERYFCSNVALGLGQAIVVCWRHRPYFWDIGPGEVSCSWNDHSVSLKVTESDTDRSDTSDFLKSSTVTMFLYCTISKILSLVYTLWAYMTSNKLEQYFQWNVTVQIFAHT